MLGNSKTGQLTGFLMNNWVPDAVPRFVIADGVPTTLGWNASSLLNNSEKLLRIVMNAGPTVASLPRVCRNFSNATVREVYLPKWFFIDMLVKLSDGEETHPINITFVQTALPSDTGNLNMIQNFFVAEKLKMTTETKDNAKNWDGIQKFYAQIGAGEFWDRLTGRIRPSWGILDAGRSGSLFLPETNFHYCYIKKGAELPDFIDDFDLSRVEGLLLNSGLTPPEYINKNKRQKDYIVKFIERIQSAD